MDVSDPANPTLVTDTTFADEDPLLPGSDLTPEGNAHQGEFSHDSQFLLAADEDFGAFRNVVRATSGADRGRAASGVEPGDGVATDLRAARRDGQRSVDVRRRRLRPGHRSRHAPADDGDELTEDIALVERGGDAAGRQRPRAASPTSSTTRRRPAGTAIIVFNQVRPDDGQVNMLTGDGGIPGVHMRRVDAIGRRGRRWRTDRADAGSGTAGPDIEVGQEFDGWGYAHLFDAKTGEELDAYAISEARDPRFADGFGDLSIHEFATDPKTSLAYAAYYAGGMRVFGFSRRGRPRRRSVRGSLTAARTSGASSSSPPTRRAADRRLGSRLRSRDPALHRPDGAVGPTPVPDPPGGDDTPKPPAAPPSGGSTPPPAAKTATIRKRAITVGKNRRFKVAVNCPATADGRCKGTLRMERGRTILANKAFSVTADRLRNVTVRLKKSDYRKLRRSKKGRMVTLMLTTRDAAGTLRQTTAKVRMRAKR